MKKARSLILTLAAALGLFAAQTAMADGTLHGGCDSFTSSTTIGEFSISTDGVTFNDDGSVTVGTKGLLLAKNSALTFAGTGFSIALKYADFSAGSGYQAFITASFGPGGNSPNGLGVGVDGSSWRYRWNNQQKGSSTISPAESGIVIFTHFNGAAGTDVYAYDSANGRQTIYDTADAGTLGQVAQYISIGSFRNGTTSLMSGLKIKGIKIYTGVLSSTQIDEIIDEWKEEASADSVAQAGGSYYSDLQTALDSGSSTVTLIENAGSASDDFTVPAGVTLNLDIYTLTASTLAVNGTVNVGGATALTATSLTGSGNIVYTAIPTTDSTLEALGNTDWEGTLTLKHLFKNGWAFNDYGNEQSTVELIGVSGYHTERLVGGVDTKVIPTIKLTDGTDANYQFGYKSTNGYSSENTTFNKWTGTGTFTSSGTPTQRYIITDGSEFEGTITPGNRSVTFGSSTTASSGQIVVDADNTVKIAQGKTWTGAAIINGTLDLSSRTSVTTAPITGNVTLGANASFKFPSILGVGAYYTLCSGTIRSSLPTTPATATATVTVGSTTYQNVYFSVSGGTIAYIPTASVTFTTPSEGWTDRTTPTTASVFSSSDARWMTADIAGNRPAIQFYTATPILQTLNGKSTLAVSVTGAGDTAGIMGSGFNNTVSGTAGATVTRDIYLDVCGGSAMVVSAGQDSPWQNTSVIKTTGNLLTQLSGDATVGWVYGAGRGGGQVGQRSTIDGNTAVVLSGNSVVKGNVVGGWGSAHNNNPQVTGNTTVIVKNIQNTFGATKYNSGLPDGNYIVGGSVDEVSNASSASTVGGNSSVLVDLANDANGTFGKILVGGSLQKNSQGTQTVSGSSSVTVNAPSTVTFSANIIGGGLRLSRGYSAVTGSSSVTLNGGTYTGTIYAGAYGTDASVGGDATLTLNGGVFTDATLTAGNASGTKKLVVNTSLERTSTNLTGFNAYEVGEGAMFTLSNGTWTPTSFSNSGKVVVGSGASLTLPADVEGTMTVSGTLTLKLTTEQIAEGYTATGVTGTGTVVFVNAESGAELQSMTLDQEGANAYAAQGISWTGDAGDYRWDSANNWSADRVPTADEIVEIGAVNTPITVTASSLATNLVVKGNVTLSGVCSGIYEVTIHEGCVLTNNVTATSELHGIVGSGELVKTGSGELQLSDNGATQHAVTAVPIKIDEGMVKVMNAHLSNPVFIIGANGSLENYGWPTITGTLVISNETAKTVFSNPGAHPSRINGAPAIMKGGAGKLTFASAAGEAGFPSVTVSAGELVFGALGSSYTTSITAATVAQGAMLAFDSAAPSTVSGAISGAGAVRVGGSGAVQIATGGSITAPLTVEPGATLTLPTTGNALGGSEGSSYNTQDITINGTSVSKGAIDLNGNPNYGYAFILAGGTLKNMGNAIGTGARQTSKLTVTEDSEVNSSSDFGLLAGGYAATYLKIGKGKTLTKKGANTFWLTNVQLANLDNDEGMGNGVFEIAEGTVNVVNNGSANNALASGAAIEFKINSDATFAVNKAFAVKDLTMNGGTISGSATLTVNGTTRIASGSYTTSQVRGNRYAIDSGATLTLESLMPSDKTLAASAGTLALPRDSSGRIIAVADGFDPAGLTVTGAASGYTEKVVLNGCLYLLPTGMTLVDGTLTVPADTTLDLDAVDTTGVTTISVADGGTLALKEVAGEGGTKSLTNVTWLGGEPSVTMTHIDGSAIASGDIVATVDGSTTTIVYPPQIYGAATSFDITFTNTYALAYKEVSANSKIDTQSCSYTEDGKGAYIKHHPYIDGIENWFRATDEITLAVVGTMPSTTRTTFIHMGANYDANYYGLLIATGDKEDEVIVAWNNYNVVHEICRMSVPNAATERHSYIVTKQDTGTGNDKITTLTVYLDGVKWKTLVPDTYFMVVGGFQVGSDFGGEIHELDTTSPNYYAQVNMTSGDGVINVLRAYDRVISAAEIAEYARVYPYVSPNGRSERTLVGTDANWIEDSESTVWKDTAASGEVSNTYQPLAGSSVTLTATASTTITVDLDENTTYEALTVNGATGATVTFETSQDTGDAVITGLMTINVPVVAKVGALDLHTSIIKIGDAGSLTVDYSAYDAREVYETTDPIQVTGDIDEQPQGKFTFVPPTTLGRTYSCTYDSGTRTYRMTITPDHTAGANVWIAGGSTYPDSPTVYLESTCENASVAYPGDILNVSAGATLGKPLVAVGGVVFADGSIFRVDTSTTETAFNGGVVTVAADAKVTVTLGENIPLSGRKILGWTQEPAGNFELSSVLFSPNTPIKASKWGLRKRDDGLYIYKVPLQILVR